MKTTLTPDQIRQRIGALDRWRHRIEVADGITTPGSENCRRELSRLRLPPGLNGLRVCDIGCSDGYYSFECERRGARVIAIDDFSSLMNPGENGFAIAAELLGSQVELRRASVLELDAAMLGRFDVVLFLNVLYHLRHPLLGLEKIAGIVKPGGRLFLKTYFHQDLRLKFRGRGVGLDWSRRPLMRFFPGRELAGDPTNWWAPNRRCIEAMLDTAGFAIDEQLGIHGDRIYYRCTRRQPGKRARITRI